MMMLSLGQRAIVGHARHEPVEGRRDGHGRGFATYAVTREFPIEERYGLASQMRRASVSIGSNIAEGCGRSTDAQFSMFLQIAMGSASELEFQATLASRLGFSTSENLGELQARITSVKRMLAKLTISRERRRKAP
jgi:four helix bundle protein